MKNESHVTIICERGFHYEVSPFNLMWDWFYSSSAIWSRSLRASMAAASAKSVLDEA